MKIITAFLLITLFAGCFGTEPEKTGQEGKILPKFSILLPDSSTTISTSQITTGSPIAIFYFSPICQYCRAQTEEIIEDMDKLKGIQFYFVTSFPLASLKSFYKEFELSKYPNITTGVDTARFFRNYFEVSGVPFTAIYGKDKKLNKAFMGNIYSSEIKKAAEE